MDDRTDSLARPAPGAVITRDERLLAAAHRLLPASAVAMWRVPDTLVHPARVLLPVPHPQRIHPDEDRPWWVLPMDGPGLLCDPARLAAIVAVGRRWAGR